MKPWYLRVFLWFFSTLFCRVRRARTTGLPVQGGALLLSNGLSLVEMAVILANTQRFVGNMEA